MTTVEEHLEDLRLHRGSVFTIVVRLRAMALASGPAITEEVKYGGILFASYAAFCGVFAYQNHVTLEFSEGNTLADPFGVLAGKGKLVFGTREVSSDVVDLHFTILIQKYEKRQPQTYSDGYRHLFS